jgi:hypothetical protein
MEIIGNNENEFLKYGVVKMEISRWDLRKALRFVTDQHYETVKDTDVNGLTKREYFDISLYHIEQNFTLGTTSDIFKIKYDNDKDATLKFLRYFLAFNFDTDLEFHISYEYGTAQIILFNKNIDENKLKEIMAFLFWEYNSMLTDYMKLN